MSLSKDIQLHRKKTHLDTWVTFKRPRAPIWKLFVKIIVLRAKHLTAVCVHSATKHIRRADDLQGTRSWPCLFSSYSLEKKKKKPTDCPAQKIPSKRLLRWICAGEAKVDGAEISLSTGLEAIPSRPPSVSFLMSLWTTLPTLRTLTALFQTFWQLCFSPHICFSKGECAWMCYGWIFTDRWWCTVTVGRSVVWNVN